MTVRLFTAGGGGGSLGTGIAVYATVAQAKAATGLTSGSSQCYVAETESWYGYNSEGSEYTPNDTTILSTGEGGDTRWIATGGDYSYGVSGLAAGSSGYLQFNDGGGSFAASANLVWDNTNSALAITDASNNLKIGSSAGASITSGANNTFLGIEAGYSFDSNDGIFIGYQAGYNISSGINNTIIGCQAAKGSTPTTNQSNVIIGDAAAYYLETGSYNVSIGASSSFYFTDGEGCINIGYEAGKYNEEGDHNIYIGYQAGYGSSDQSNYYNFGAGKLSLASITTGQYNICSGFESGRYVTSGNGNILQGKHSGHGITTENYHIALGHEALYSAAGTAGAIAIGYQASYAMSSGDASVCIGFEVCRYNQTGSYNTLIGYQAGRGATGQSHSGNTAIGYQSLYSVTTGSNNCIWGYQAAYSLLSSNGVVALGYKALYSATTNSSNSIAIGYEALYACTSYHCIGIGQSAGYSNTGYGAINIGAEAGKNNTSGIKNTFVGYQAGKGAAVGQYYGNTGIGASALEKIRPDGNYNTAIGYQAANALTTSDYVVAIGYTALRYGTDSISECVAIGTFALENTNAINNFGIGSYAGRYNESGTDNCFIGIWSGLGTSGESQSYNTAIGIKSLYSLGTDSDYNVGIGYQAGYYATGEGNIFIGANAGPSGADATDNNLYIANAASNPFLKGTMDNSGTGGLLQLRGTFYPDTDSQYDLGTDSLRWATAYIDAVEVTDTVRASTAVYRRYYHLPLTASDPGASGATWTDAGANNLSGWRLDADTETLQLQSDIHSDWDGASDITVEVVFQLMSAGSADDTVDLKLSCYYMGDGDVATKSQIVEVATVTDGTQYKMYTVSFTIEYDYASNNVDAGDKISMILNLETDTSEIDDVLIVDASIFYQTAHVGIESGDT